MKNESITAHAIAGPKSARRFLQPIVVALVCLTLICLFLIMGLVNLRTLDKALAGLMENNGLSIIRNVQQVGENYFRELIQGPHAGFDPDTGNPLGEDAFVLPESFLIELTELARKIDSGWEINRPSYEQLTSLSSEESLWLIAFLDDEGNITLRSRTIPGEILDFIRPVVAGHAEFKMNLFDRTEDMKGLRVIALRRRSGTGTVALALDESAFRQRSLRFSIQRAVEEIGMGENTAYFIMQDQRNSIIGLAGDLLENRLEELQKKNPFQDTGRSTTRKIMLGDKSLLEIAVPIRIGGKYAGIIGLGLNTDTAEHVVKKNRNSVIFSTGFMVVIAFLSMGFLYKNQNRYLSRMQAMERRIHQAERLSAVGRLAAGVAHEVRNPLNAISMAVQRLQRDNPHKLIKAIQEEIKRLNQIVEEFLSVSRSRKLEFTRHDLTELLEQIVLLIAEEVESKGIKLKTRWSESPLMVSMDLGKMKQALLNVINNAMESISNEGSISVSAKRSGKDRVSIAIKDTGIGLSSEEIKHIFELDYTTKDKGLGLGLALAYEIIRGHGGEARVASQPGMGTTFEIFLPGDSP